MSDLASTLHDLYQRFGELPGVQIEIHKNLPAVTVSNDLSTATVFLQGAQISHFEHHGQKPVLFLSEANTYEEGKPLRGGIPLCWPWFGNLDKNPGIIQTQISQTDAPAHGFLRNLAWQLKTIQAEQTETQLVLTANIDANSNTLWPFATELQLQITVGETLTVTLSVKNCDTRDFHYSLAMHTYFQVSDIHQVSVDGLDEEKYFDALDQWQLKTQAGSLQVSEEVDRVYEHVSSQATGELKLNDKGISRNLFILTKNLPSLVTWNPWLDKSKTLSQFYDNDFNQMLCLESAAVKDNCVTLATGETQTHTLEIIELNI